MGLRGTSQGYITLLEKDNKAKINFKTVTFLVLFKTNKQKKTL